MIHTPRPPRPVSLAELITLGYLSENDVLPGGHVDESRRRQAEERFLASRPQSAPTRPPPQSSSSRPRTTTQGSSAHVHRVKVRRRVQGMDRVPMRMLLDACCICFTNVRDQAVVPCFHMCVCSVCSKHIQHCPLCRCPIERMQRIFI